MFKKTTGGSIFVVVLVALCVWVVSANFPPPLGIDLQGGSELLYSIDISKVDTEARGDRNYAEDAKEVIYSRINETGLKDITVSVVGSQSLLVEIPGKSDAERKEIIRIIEQAGQLSFNLLADAQFQTPDVIAQVKKEEAEYYAKLADFNNKKIDTAPEPLQRIVLLEKLDKKEEAAGKTPSEYVVENVDGYMVDGKYLKAAGRETGQDGFPVISFEFTGEGRTLFANLTGENTGKSMAINLDGRAWSVATINDRIVGRGQLSGDYEEEELAGIVTILNGGSLPAELVRENQQTIGPSLGRASIERGTQAMAIGLTLVIVFMVVYYMAGGIIANIALALNLLLVLSCLIVFSNTLTFPGIAGLLLTVGMSVDANILIFERIREEKLRGRSLNQAVALGYQRAFWTIFDANLTTLLTAFILFQFGSGPVKGFAVVLSVGILASFFTAIFVTRLVLSLLMKANMVTDLKMLQVLGDTSIDFLKLQKPMRTLSVGFIIVGVICMMVRGSDGLGLDFTGGSRLVVNLKQAESEDRMRQLMTNIKGADGQLLFDDVQVQGVGDELDGKYASFTIRTREAKIQQEGDEVTMNPTEVFQTEVEKVVVAANLLAPDPVAELTEADDKSVTMVANVRDVNTVSLEKALVDGGFPLKSVAPREGGGSALYQQFVITSQPLVDVSPDQAQTQVLQIFRDKNVEASEAFSAVDAIGSRVAQDLQGKIFVAMMIAFGVIVFYISLRFQFKFGLAAIVALVHDILFALGALSVADLVFGGFLDLKITLAVMAALLTVVGYSLNDTIVIFDRIRENIAGKKRDIDYNAVVNASINQTLRRTVLTSATTFVVVSILLIWGGSALQGFAFAMCVGVVIGTFSSIYIASPALIYFHGRSERRREMILAEAAAGGKS